jgi:D-3-phosphoglycerate dehydrogenase
MNILITAPSFALHDPEPLELLEAEGFSLIRNQTGKAYSKSEMISIVSDVEGIILGVDTVDADVINAAPKLKAISRYGVGMNNIDVEYAKTRGINVLNAAGANADAVADAAMTLMLAAAKKLLFLDAAVRQSDFSEVETFEMNGKTLGLIGLGNIGAKVARRAKGFDMTVLAYDVTQNAELAAGCGAVYMETLEALLETSDFVSLHLPILPDTYHIIGEREIARMKPGAVLINTARGGLIDEDALAAALLSGKLLGAGLDVFETEPLPLNSPLNGLINVVMTPHASADTYESTGKVSRAAALNLISALKNTPDE